MTNLETFDYRPELESYEAEWGAETEWGGEAEVFSEAEVAELAAEMLEVTTEAELDRFFGDLINRAGRALGGFVPAPIGQAVGGWLKGAGKSALNRAGRALGGRFGGLGTQISGGLASAISSALGLEAEMSQEDREFEGAKNFVKMAADAVKSAVSAPATANPVEVAKAAVKAAVEKRAPGLLGGMTAPGLPSGVAAPGLLVRADRPARKMGRTGRWVRHGRNVIIVNCG